MLATIIPCIQSPERDVISYNGGDFEDVGNVLFLFCFVFPLP